MKAEEWRKSCGEDDAILSSCIDDLAESETLVAVLKKAIAHSSTQCREMVKALDECRRGITSMIARTEQLHDSPKSLLDSMTRDLPDMVSTVEHIDAAMKRSTP